MIPNPPTQDYKDFPLGFGFLSVPCPALVKHFPVWFTVAYLSVHPLDNDFMEVGQSLVLAHQGRILDTWPGTS